MFSLFDFIVLVVIAVFAFSGLRRGFVDEAVRLIGLTLAIYAGVRYHYLGIKLVSKLLSISESVQSIISFVIIFLAVYLAIQMVGSILKSVVRTLKLVWLNRIAGLIFGAVKGVVIIAVVVWFISLFPELGIERRVKSSSNSYPLISNFKDKAISTFRLENELNSLRYRIRKIFLLESEQIDQEEDKIQ